MFTEIYDDLIKETVLKYTHPGGTEIFMLPMRGHSGACAQFSVKFGSQDNAFYDGGRLIKIPDGTAHYLEHKLFESEEKDAFALFAETGASCNAGTSFDYTQYYFSCTDSFAENLEILLGFVAQPYFTDENVEKERGIIGQEITMYRDNPSWRVFTNLLESVYHSNPVRLDIAGTTESISKITPQTLYDCYNAYYNPSNMFLCISGNFDPDEAAEICEKSLKSGKKFLVKPAEFDEPYPVARKYVKLSMPVAKPMFEIGFKMSAADGEKATEDYIYYNILVDIIFGQSSEFYEKMREGGVLNDEWSVSVFSGRGHFFPLARGESGEPEKVLEEMQKTFRAFKSKPFSKEEFARVKKATYGAMVRDFANVQSVCSALSDAALAGVSPFCALRSAAGAEYEKIVERLMSFDEENAALSVIG